MPTNKKSSKTDTPSAQAGVRARIVVYPRPEILDPQGKAIADALSRLGFDQVRDLRAGKSFDVTVAAGSAAEAEKLARQMADKLLANAILEDFTVEILGDEGAGGAGPAGA